MNGISERANQLAVYYLRIGIGFVTLWTAWDVIVHQVQVNAFFAAFPLGGVLSGQIMVAWFVILLACGVLIFSGWYFREATAILGVFLLLSLLVFNFMAPNVNAVLGPFRPLFLKNLVWFGACLMLVVQPTDPFNPERRRVAGLPALQPKIQLVFRAILGVYCIWDGLLQALNANHYLTFLSGTFTQIPLVPDNAVSVIMVLFYIVQMLAGVMILTGIKYRWALTSLAAIVVIHLIGMNWFAGKDLLRAGGRFMMRDMIVLTSIAYFWLTGPGSPILQVSVEKKSPLRHNDDGISRESTMPISQQDQL
ncbi:hypothetical protein K8S19_00645 [bacterium]|nr:hypothetical protein [bacterium]